MGTSKYLSFHLYTYSGMLIWGGAVSVGQHNDSVVPLYDLNNFGREHRHHVGMGNVDRQKLTPTAGIEPATTRLKAGRSTD